MTQDNPPTKPPSSPKPEQSPAGGSDTFFEQVYDELRAIAHSRMRKEQVGQTLQSTELVHEAYLRLSHGKEGGWENRGHFFAAAAEAMRRILIDRARRKRAVRHGGEQQRVDIQHVDLPSANDEDQLLAVHEALDKLSIQHPSEAELVKLRYFVGMTNDEAAEALGISPRTAKYYWTHARAWLFREINGRDEAR